MLFSIYRNPSCRGVIVIINPKGLRGLAVKDVKCGFILEAARKVFSEKGYWDTRLEDIANLAGFCKTSIYNYFPDKETIFLSLVINDYQTILDHLKKIVQDDRPFMESVNAILPIMLSSQCSHFAIYLDSFSTQNYQAKRGPLKKHSQLLQRFHKTSRQIIETISTIISHGRSQHFIHIALDDKSIAILLCGLTQATLLHWGQSPSFVGKPENAVLHIIDFLSHGLFVLQPKR